MVAEIGRDKLFWQDSMVAVMKSKNTHKLHLNLNQQSSASRFKPFSSDTGTSRTDRQTDGLTDLLYQYRASEC